MKTRMNPKDAPKIFKEVENIIAKESSEQDIKLKEMKFSFEEIDEASEIMSKTIPGDSPESQKKIYVDYPKMYKKIFNKLSKQGTS